MGVGFQGTEKKLLPWRWSCYCSHCSANLLLEACSILPRRYDTHGYVRLRQDMYEKALIRTELRIRLDTVICVLIHVGAKTKHAFPIPRKEKVNLKQVFGDLAVNFKYRYASLHARLNWLFISSIRSLAYLNWLQQLLNYILKTYNDLNTLTT